MPTSTSTNAAYIAVMYTMMLASATTWIFFLQATLARDRVNV